MSTTDMASKEDIAHRMGRLKVAINDWSPMTMVDTYQQEALNMILFEITELHSRIDAMVPEVKVKVRKAA